MQVHAPTRQFSQYWWLLLIWGILVVLFGLSTIFWPHLTLLTLIFLFGAFALVNGILGIATAIQERNEMPFWGTALAAGIISLLIGLAVMFWPRATAILIHYFIASWAVIIGILQLAEAISGKNQQSPLFLVIAGIASLLLGIVLFASSTVVALLALVWLIGIYALVYGVMLIARAFYLRSLFKQHPEQYREPEFMP